MSDLRQKLIKQIQIRLGGGIIDLELESENYNYAIDVALDNYRLRSGNALEESFVIMTLQPEVQTYTLPDIIQQVKNIYRRSYTGTTSGGPTVDPFSLATTQSLYSMMSPSSMGSMAGSLATLELSLDYTKLAMRMLGSYMQFTFNPSNKQLFIERMIQGNEEILLHVYNIKPENILLSDPYAKVWLRDYATAVCMDMLGSARAKFTGLAGPNGGVNLNGESLKSEAKNEFERLIKELRDLVDQSVGYSFIIG